MEFTAKNIRKIIYGSSALIAVLIYSTVSAVVKSATLQQIRLTEAFALTALAYLYITLLPSPLYKVFPKLPFRPMYKLAQRALGVSTFFFALIHASIAFFGLLGGFSGLGFLSNDYLTAIALSFIALIILAALAATSFDYAVRLLGKKWKWLHRLVYLAGILIVIHAFLLGTQFADLSGFVPTLFFLGAFFLLAIESIRFDMYIHAKLNLQPRFGIAFVLLFALLVTFTYTLFFSTGSGTGSFGIHAQHLKQAQLAAQTPQYYQTRYTASFNTEGQLTPGKPVTLLFTVYDASTGTQIENFDQIYDEQLHLIIVNQELTYFSHINPTFQNGEFSITTAFPKNDIYHLYTDFQPVGGNEQLFAFTLNIGNVQAVADTQPADASMTKTFGNYSVTLSSNAPLTAAALNAGTQVITLTIDNSKTGAPITALQPYLNAFGHLTMVDEQTYDYLHVHPKEPVYAPLGGPAIDFTPIALYKPASSGTYRVFFEFQTNNKVQVCDFTVIIK